MNWFNNKTRNLNYMNNNMSEDLKNNSSDIGNKKKDDEKSNFLELNRNIENISKFNQDDLNIESIIKEKFDLVDKIYLSKKKIQEILTNKNIFFTNMELDNIYRIATKKNLNEITFDTFLNNLISSNKINNYFKVSSKDNSLKDNEKFTHENTTLTEAIKKINNKNDLNENQINLNSKILKNEIDKIHKVVIENAKDINYLSNKINQDKIIKNQNMQDNNNTNNLNRDFFRLILLEEEQKKNLLDLQTDKLRRIFFNEIRSLYNFNNNSAITNHFNDINAHDGSYNLNSMRNHCDSMHFKNKNHFPINDFKNTNHNYDTNKILYNPQNENDYNWKNIYESSESKLNNLENLILNLYDKFDKSPSLQEQTELNKLNETRDFEDKIQNLDNSNSFTILDDSPNQNLDDFSKMSNDVFSLCKELEKANTSINEINNLDDTSSKNINNSNFKENLLESKDIDLDNEKKKINFKNELFFENKINGNKFDKLEFLLEGLRKKIDENLILFNKNKKENLNKISNDLNNNLFWNQEFGNNKLKDDKIKYLENAINDLKNEIEIDQYSNNTISSIQTLPSNSLNGQIENIQTEIKEVKNEIESKFNSLSNDLNKDKENLINKIELFFEKNSIESQNINKKLLLDSSNVNDKNKFVYLNFDDNNNFSKVNEIFEENNSTLKSEKLNTQTLTNDYSAKITNLENNFNKKINLENIDSNDIENEDDKASEKNLLFKKFNKDINDKDNEKSNLKFHNQQENNLLSSKDFLNNKEKNIDKNSTNNDFTENVLNETAKDNYNYENNNNHYLNDNINNYRESLEKDVPENLANDNIDDFLNNLDKKIINNVKDLSNIKNILNGENIDKQVLSDLDVSISLFDSMSKN